MNAHLLLNIASSNDRHINLNHPFHQEQQEKLDGIFKNVKFSERQ